MSKLDEIFKEHKPTGEELGHFEDIKVDIKELILNLAPEFVPMEHWERFVRKVKSL